MTEFGLEDIRTLEDDMDASPENMAMSLQRAINSGMWSLQGSYGRSMMDAIKTGNCMLGPNPARDYYDNLIPSRDMVQDGTKGSRQYVVERKGEDWALMLEGV